MTSLKEAEIDRDLQQIAAGYRAPLRSPIPHTPAEHDLKFEDVMFPSEDSAHKILHDAGYNVLAYDRGSRQWNLPAHEDG